MKYGLLGQKLGHSYSPAIHRLFGYDYGLFEVEAEQLEDFLTNGDFRGLNVTMPYKKAVIPYLDALSPAAKALGAVNTILRTEKLIGHNTDYFGFSYLLQSAHLDVQGKKCLVLGSGGASNTVCAVLKSLGARVVVISRSGENNYENLQQHKDATLIVNTTPIGMYPNTGRSPLSLSVFEKPEAVLDVVYNPARTALMLEAEAMGIPSFGGLAMLVAQAWESARWFTGRDIPEPEIDRILQILQRQTENILLIGMPGCGKSTIGRLLAERTGRPFADADACIEEKAGLSVPEIFTRYGQEQFRRMETEVLRELGKQSGLVIACGGGAVTQPQNYDLLHQNGRMIWLQRDLSLLATDGRPLSAHNDLEQMYIRRQPMYAAFADLRVSNNGTPEETVRNILEAIQ